MAKTIWTYISEWMDDNARNAGDVDANVALRWFNRRYHEIENKITTFIMDNYINDFLEIDLVAWMNSYQLPTWDSQWPTLIDQPEFNKLLEISINYGNWHYIKAREMPEWDLYHPIEWYTTHASRHNPMFRFTGKNLITIFPEPTRDVEWGIHIIYSSATPDVEATDDETVLTIPRQYIWVILLWMNWDNAKAVKDPDVLMYKQDYYQAIEDMLAVLSDRYIQPSGYRNPYLGHLMN